jgi:Uma2 family endonuclease
VVAVARASLPVLLPALPEQRILIHGVTWKDYVILREALDTPGIRMTFCEGSLELMSPSRLHELWKTTIARLVELYALELDLPLIGYGSTTFRKEAAERGAEPDECYRVGVQMKDGEIPDIALEIIHTAPLLDKLHVYAGLGVPEVWLFLAGAFEIHELVGGRYRRVATSRLVPGIDFDLVARLAVWEDQIAALKELRESLRSAAAPPRRKAPRGRRRVR